jgi:hypothetical protein
MLAPPGVTYQFDETRAIEQLILVFSKTPRTEWVASIGRKPIASEELEQLLKRYETTPQFELVGKETSVSAPASREHALYAAQPSSDAGRPLILEIRLKHGP